MHNVRFIARLDVKGDTLIKSIQLEGVRVVGDPRHSAREFYEQGADEILLTEEFFDLDEQRQLDCVVDLAVPWYLKFYVSWYDADRRGAYRFMWVRYEDMLADSTVFFMKIMDHCGIPVDRQRLARAVEELQGPAIRFNKGVAGRGQERLSADQQARIRTLCSHYPHIDFADLGI